MYLRPNIPKNTLDIVLSEREVMSYTVPADGSLRLSLTAAQSRVWIEALTTGMETMATNSNRCVCGKCSDYVPGTVTIDTMSTSELLAFLARLPEAVTEAALSEATATDGETGTDAVARGYGERLRSTTDYSSGYPSAPANVDPPEAKLSAFMQDQMGGNV